MSSESFARAPLFQAHGRHGNVDLMVPSLASFGRYAEAFRRGGRFLAARLAAAEGYSDLDACPIVFLYRHSLELYLKGIGLAGGRILHLRGIALPNSQKLLKTHRLSAITPFVQRIFSEIEWDWETDVEGLRTFQEFEALIGEIEKVDAESFAFRYPVSTRGESSLPRNFRFNVFEFSDKLEPLLDGLDGVNAGLAAMWDLETEAYLEEMQLTQEVEYGMMMDNIEPEELG
jgi:hypothetical protein